MSATTTQHLTNDAMMHLLAGTTMTVRRKARLEGHTSWLGVTSLKAPVNVYVSAIDPMMFDELSVLWIEMPNEALAKTPIDESAVEINGRFTVSGIAELEKLLVGLGVAPAALALKDDTGYPL
jgi:hypothetical protein